MSYLASPSCMNTLYAKSADRGGETLTQHTEQVLRRLVDQIRLHPSLPVQLNMPHLWDWLYWGVFLHDFGKAAEGFQALLKGNKGEWSDQKHRHEALSLIFVDWLFPKDSVHRMWVMAVIATHHKDSSYMREMYGGTLSQAEQLKAQNPLSDSLRIKWPYLKDQIDPGVQKCLWTWLSEYGSVWAEELGIPLSLKPGFTMSAQGSPGRAILHALYDLYKWQQHLTPHEHGVAHLVRGLILTADHAASAGTPVFPALPLTTDKAYEPLKERTVRYHQREMQQPMSEENRWTLLVAPTGSGKTEAALLWAAVQHVHHPAARLFYTLPYQASMNAMADRLLRAYFTPDKQLQALTLTSEDNTILTIQHSRATLKFFQQHMDAEPNARQARDKANERKNLGNLNFHPVRVFSPYQMLKAAYSLKGYETLLLDYVDALFIFDEIHAYEPKRLALIVTFLGWLVTHYNVRCLVMTATLPPLVRDALTQALGDPRIVRADETTFKESQRHRVNVVSGEILDYVDDIVRHFRTEHSVLVVCNTVNRAQEIYGLLQTAGLIVEGEDGREILLLHGRFNGRDRIRKEKMLMRRVGVGKQPRLPMVVVATQVVEVSLDVDFDVLYSDPAPIEALVQRFGRVNRGRKERTLCDVFVCERPIGEKESRPYDSRAVELALHHLRSYNGQALDEAHITTMLEAIYQDDQIAAQWHEDYDKTRREFSSVILDTMTPFESADIDQMKKFYALFDGIDVLPADLANDYSDAREKEGWLSASQYAVNINWGQYCMLKKKGLIQPAGENDYLDQVFVAYDDEAGLQFNAPLPRKTPLNTLFILDDDL